jgi:hypothetical protein
MSLSIMVARVVGAARSVARTSEMAGSWNRHARMLLVC